YGARHATGKTLLAVVLEDPGDLLLVGAGDPLGSADPRLRVHAHVQRAVIEEAEAALRVVQLRRGDSQIQQHAADGPTQALLGDRLAHLGEAALDDGEARVLGGQ